jgi:hypothetical protein
MPLAHFHVVFTLPTPASERASDQRISDIRPGSHVLQELPARLRHLRNSGKISAPFVRSGVYKVALPSALRSTLSNVASWNALDFQDDANVNQQAALESELNSRAIAPSLPGNKRGMRCVDNRRLLNAVRSRFASCSGRIHWLNFFFLQIVA